jgi:hypothetical protein
MLKADDRDEEVQKRWSKGLFDSYGASRSLRKGHVASPRDRGPLHPAASDATFPREAPSFRTIPPFDFS